MRGQPVTLNTLRDVNPAGISNGNVPIWDAASRTWKPGSAGGGTPVWKHDRFVVPSTPVTLYALTFVPLGINVLAKNGSVLAEDTDYTVDYVNGTFTLASTPTASDVLFCSYVIAATTTHLIADTFNRADSATTINPASDGGTWTVDTAASGDVWGISSNRGYLVTRISTQTLVRRDLGSVACDVTAVSVRSSTAQSSWIVLSYDPVLQRGYTLYFDSSAASGLEIDRVDYAGGGHGGGVSGVIACTTWTGSSSTLRVIHDGVGHFSVYQNGAHLGDYTDTVGTDGLGTAFGGTWVGMQEGNSTSPNRWDNFTANP